MARIRTVKPEFWQHPKVCAVSRDSRLLFLGLLNEADDDGRLRYQPKRLAGVLFPDDGDVDAYWISDHTAELNAAGLVRRYQVDGADLLVVPGFREHQVINKPRPSTLPAEPLPDDSGSPPVVLPDECVGERNGMEGNREGNTYVGSADLSLVEPKNDPVRAVFDFWCAELNHPRAHLDDKRRRRIVWALKHYPVEDVLDAIRGCKASPYHQGQNDTRTVYDDLTLILRDATHLEKFRALQRDAAPAPVDPATTRVRGGVTQRFMLGAGWISEGVG